MRIQTHRVQEWEELIHPGDYLLCLRAPDDPEGATKGVEYALLVCPRCLRASSWTEHPVVYREPLTIRNRFLCRQIVQDQPCGWQGRVWAGVLTDAAP